MPLHLPPILARLTANQRLMKACTEFGALDDVRRALNDGADPNHEMFHRTWQERTGTCFDVKQWWGGRRNEPIYGSTRHENYWRTPLACATDKGDAAIVHVLLKAGANPWALGNGSSGWARPSPMSNIFRQTYGQLGMVDILDQHFDHLVKSYPETDVVASWNNLDHFQKVAAKNPQAARFIEKLRSSIEAGQLQQGTLAPAHSQAAPRRRF